MYRTRFALLLLLSAAWLGLAGPRGLAAQPVPLGPEIELPNYDFPGKPLLAVQPDGTAMVVWDEEVGLQEEVFSSYIAAGRNPVGGWTIVSPVGSVQTDAVMATPTGFDVIWHVPNFDEPTAFYRGHLNLRGVPDGRPILVGRVGTDWVWQLRDKQFMAGWVLPHKHAIAARRLSSSGRRTGPEMRLNSRRVDAMNTAVLGTADGGFMAFWYGAVPDSTAAAVLRARRFSPAGIPLGPDFDVNTLPTGAVGRAPYLDPYFQVAAAPGGGFAVAWGIDFKIYLRFFDAAGQALGPEVPAALGERAFGASSLAFDNTGNLMLLWFSNSDLRLQLFDPNGAPLGPSTSVRSAASTIFREPWGGSVPGRGTRGSSPGGPPR